MRPEAAHSRVRADPSTLAGAGRPTWTARPCRQAAPQPCSPAPDRPPVRTSRPEPPASDPKPTRSVCSETPRHRTSRLSRGSPPASQTTDARDTKVLETPSRGRSQALFYNHKRPHSKLGWTTPAAYSALCREGGRGAALRQGSAPRPLAMSTHEGSDHRRTLVTAG